jgi:GNAT superfamily N-acetyltransferase
MRLLAVAADARGRSVGRLLPIECLRRSLDAGAPGLGLPTMEMMVSAKRLHTQIGFARDVATDFHIPAPSPVLVKGYVIQGAAAHSAFEERPSRA